LVCAYRRYLGGLDEEQIPAEVRGSFEQVMRSLRGVQPLRGEDAVAASVRKMSNQEADDCASLIVEIFGLMCKSHVTAMRTNGVVQLHAVERAAEQFEAPALSASN
jgi:hypothetical protein